MTECVIMYTLSVPVPIVITCFDLTLLANGDIDYGGAGSPSSRPVNTVATYTCVTGYTLNGGSTRTCGSDGVWSGFAPVCQRKWNGCLFVECIISHTGNCPDLPSLTNGMIIYSAGSTNNRPFISRATHSCNTGYTLTEGTFTIGTTRVCVSGGMWDGSPPTCQGEWNELCTVFVYCLFVECMLIQELVLIYHH